ncbi:MAG: tRNA lysidine(34) synthetase TilS [candidate division Zixibacteria bacterium]|nr:tRNA lysidine(34) synthetase TilS [candidate division Zixibacteria bacterium]
MDILQKVRATIADKNLLRNEDSVLVALSGGPDSVGLLHILTKLRSEFSLTLQAVYINHLIRPRAAKKEEIFCQNLCDKLHIPLTIVTEHIPLLSAKIKKGIEETARDFRYETFSRLGFELGCSKVALGHHFDDRAETILFRLIRGAGRTGLIGIPARRGVFIRPFFEVTKVEILSYLKTNRLEYCLDKSNSNSQFSRNFIRNQLLPSIRKNLNPQIDTALANTADLLAEEELYFEAEVKKALSHTLTISPGAKLFLDLQRFDKYHKAIRRRILRHCLERLEPRHLPPEREVVNRLEDFVIREGAEFSLPGHVQAARIIEGGSKKLLLWQPKTAKFSSELELGAWCELESLGIKIKASRTTSVGNAVQKKRRARKVFVDGAALALPLEVRSFRPGDKFRPLGMAGNKKIGDYLTDKKIARPFRDEVVVVCDRAGIVWLVGFEIAERVKVTVRTKEAFVIENSLIKTKQHQTL